MVSACQQTYGHACQYTPSSGSISKVNFFGIEAYWDWADSFPLKGEMLALIRGPKPFGVGSKVLDSVAKEDVCVICGVSCPLCKSSCSDGEKGMPGDCSPAGVVARSLPSRFKSSSWCSLLWGVPAAGTKCSF